jgi:protein N-terminal glutamine amidohydrolase
MTSFVYTKYFCEENIYHLCKLVVSQTLHFHILKSFVVFISNPAKKVPIGYQKSSTNSVTGLIIWDYHVILIVINEEHE